MAKEWIAVLRAADAAARWHVHQRRKGAAEEPYINHLLAVATLVAEATEGRGDVAIEGGRPLMGHSPAPRQNCCKRRGNPASGTLVLIAVIGSVAQRTY